MKIKIICISDSLKHFQEPVQEYIKRLGKDIEIIDVKPSKIGTKNQIIQKETENIIEKISKIDCYKILLSINWEHIDSIEFAKIIGKWNDICFIIWGPYWLDESKIWEYINKKISFWKTTFPHWLAKLILLEQIYRSKMINENRQYHY